MNFFDYSDEIHDNVEQRKRFESSLKKNIKILSLDTDAASAEFEGSTGDTYITALSGCSCMDYSIRKLPCKHMYRLAVECHLIDPAREPWKTYKEYPVVLKRIKKKIDGLCWEDLKRLDEYLSKNLGD